MLHPGAIQPAHKQVERPAQVVFGAVGRPQALAQQAVQGQGVEGRLHVVTVLQHGSGQGGGGVGAAVGPQGVGFVIQHPVAPAVGKHQVGKAHGHAVQLALGQGGACLSGQQIVLAQGIDRAAGERGQGQPELHLGELGGEGGQGAIQRRQRGVA